MDTLEETLGLRPVAKMQGRALNSEASRLVKAVRTRNVEQVQSILNSHPPAAKVKVQGLTALHVAATEGDANCVKALLEYSAADAVSADNVIRVWAEKGISEVKGTIPLFLAIRHNHPDCVRLLLPVSPPTFRTEDDQTARMWTAGSGHLECLEELLRWGVDARERSDESLQVAVSNEPSQVNALMRAAYNGHTACVQRLLAVSDVQAQTSKRWSALSLAAQEGHLDTVKVLLRAYPDGVAGWDGQMALNLSLRQKKWPAFEWLVSHTSPSARQYWLRRARVLGHSSELFPQGVAQWECDEMRAAMRLEPLKGSSKDLHRGLGSPEEGQHVGPTALVAEGLQQAAEPKLKRRRL